MNLIKLHLIMKKKISVPPINKASKGKIEIEIKVKLKSCNVRYRRKLRNCCDKYRHDVCIGFIIFMGIIIYGAIVYVFIILMKKFI